IPALIDLTPALPGIASARLGRLPETGLPFVLRLAFEPAARPTVDALVAAFGAYRVVPTDRGRPATLHFMGRHGEAFADVEMFAEIASGAHDVDRAHVERVSLQRVPRRLAQM